MQRVEEDWLLVMLAISKLIKLEIWYQLGTMSARVRRAMGLPLGIYHVQRCIRIPSSIILLDQPLLASFLPRYHRVAKLPKVLEPIQLI